MIQPRVLWWLCVFGMLVLPTIWVPNARPEGTQQLPPPQVFPAVVDLVRIDVVVVDRDGRAVTGLSASDFEVSEGGREHLIESFERIVVPPPAAVTSQEEQPEVSLSRVLAPDAGRAYVLFFDDVHVSSAASAWFRRNVVTFLDHEVGDADWVTIIAPEENVWWSARTPWEHRQLPELIRRLSGQLLRNPFKDFTDYEAMRVVEYGSRTGADSASRGSGESGGSPVPLLAESAYAAVQRRARRTLDALLQAVESLSAFRGRKTLFLYSEGFVHAPSLERLYGAVIESARRANVVLHFVAVQGLAGGLMDASNNQSCGDPTCLATEAGGSNYLATETGGRVFLSNDVITPIRTVLQQSSAYYLIGFQPSSAVAGGHSIRIRVHRPGVEVLAAERYYVTASAPGKSSAQLARGALHAGADATAVPLRVSTAVGGQLHKGEREVTMFVEFQPNGKATGSHFDFITEARRLQGGDAQVDTGEVDVPANQRTRASVQLHLRPGVWQLRVAVADRASKALGSAVHTFEVPAGQGR